VSGHVFVDETKDRGYFVAAAALLPSDLVGARQIIRGLILPRQRRIHFFKENDPRRNKILAAIAALGVQAVIYDGSAAANEKDARRACLAELVADLAKTSARRLVIERDDSVIEFDKRLLYQHVRAAGVADDFRYDHMRAHEECLLAIPDAIAWCWARGGQWRLKVKSIVTEVRPV
jgi:hypothetical protein